MTWASQVPEATIHGVFLPNLAYLRSARDQTLPARELALADALDHFAEAEASGDAHWRDLALLGVMGESMQILEDLAYIGGAYTGPDRYQLARYVSATVFSAFTATTFYQQLKKWLDDRLLEFGGLRFQADDGYISVHEALGAQLTGEQVAAISEAEAATAKLLRRHLTSLARTWETFSTYFHAFKHGALVLRRDDFFVADDDGEEIDVHPSISVWLRRKPEGLIHGDTTLSPREVAEESSGQARLASAIADYIAKARLAVLNMAGFDAHGNVGEARRITVPWRFWLDVRDLPVGTGEVLEELGVIFSQD